MAGQWLLLPVRGRVGRGFGEAKETKEAGIREKA